MMEAADHNLCLVPVSSLSSLSDQQGRSPSEPDAVLAKDTYHDRQAAPAELAVLT